MKLYRYRPLNGFLFKELKYSEIYLAQYKELNDPQDINCSINFYSDNHDLTHALGCFLHRRLIEAHGFENFMKLKKLFPPELIGDYLIKVFSECKVPVVTHEKLKELMASFYGEYLNEKMFPFNEPTVDELFESVVKITNAFLKNSSVACFSETYDNFLMWSHYAGAHNGVCLEFEVDVANESQDEPSMYRLSSTVDFLYEGKPIEYWTNIHEVQYGNAVATIDFYEFYHAFINEGDTDLMNLSKSRWHPYAEYLQQAFIRKLTPWQQEKEWRIVRVEFKESMPEDRILKYTETSLKAVYFGSNVDVHSKIRIENILGPDKQYYDCFLTGTDVLKATEISMDSIKDSHFCG